jgi:peptidoglycan/xylan/chitin deacetylase (PgdA/CDA1 family)
VRNWEFIGHGVSASQTLTELMTESEERAYIAQSIEAIAAATGKRPAGWASVEFAESSRTVRLLAEQGIRYVCDWPNDEQPYRMRVPVGEMVSLPVTIELDDIFALRLRRLPAPKLGQMMKEAFDRLYHDGAGTGRLLVLSVHPWMIGQPFRIRHWIDALQYIAGHRKVWFATGSEIINWFLEQTA